MRSLCLSFSLSLALLTALLEHACIIHLATSRMWGLVKNWTHHGGKQRAAEGDGKEEERRKTEWQREVKMEESGDLWV